MAAAVRGAGAEVGIYSTPRQWHLIVGAATPSSSLAGAPTWSAGGATREGALASCGWEPLTPGGGIRMAQWVEHGIDHDISCSVGVTGTRPEVSGEPAVGTRLVADPASWGPDGVRLRYQWLRDGVAIPGATDAAYTAVDADAGTRVAVRVSGSRIGAPTLTLTSPAVLVPEPVGSGPAAIFAQRMQRFGL
jgi:hypothetical protein